MQKKRIAEWDYVKGFLIIMVILGHTTAAFGDYEKPGLLIYFSSYTVSFIMPFFLLTTGYFLNPSSYERLSDFVKAKSRRLLYPALVWGGTAGCLQISINVAKMIRAGSYSAEALLYRVISYTSSLWYLFASWLCAVILGCIVKKVPEKYAALALSLCAVALHLIPTDQWYVAFAFSFILTGYFLRMAKFELGWFDRHSIVCCITIVLYLALLFWYKYDFSVYVAGCNLFTNNPMGVQIKINGFRWFMGILGSVSTGYILHLVWKFMEAGKSKFLNVIGACVVKLGEMSLEMYCTQFLIVECVFLKIMNRSGLGKIFSQNPYICYFVWRHLIGLLMIAAVYYVGSFFKRKAGKWLY